MLYSESILAQILDQRLILALVVALAHLKHHVFVAPWFLLGRALVLLFVLRAVNIGGSGLAPYNLLNTAFTFYQIIVLGRPCFARLGLLRHQRLVVPSLRNKVPDVVAKS